ncbi:hypothetical protein FALBO_12926 [Fusarium albosuccineum]|uniref:Uncharacterized protein n=1 Tax=Fusarium albosuccineum TaxID=1237068 RepID=A0A8H4L2G4_9HYPO|nr:hypothetical protein FALBO_12926 [Fusarium albosuccineum]
MSGQPGLLWVELGPEGHVLNNAARKTIRVHAMQGPASERKRTGTWGKRNMRQFRVLRLQDGHQEYHSTGDTSCLVPRWSLGTPSSPLPVLGVERLAVDTGVNILDLNELTHVHMGHAAGVILSRQPATLSKLASRRRESFLSYLPSRYGNTPCLDDALRCVAMKARRCLTSDLDPPKTTELSLYGKALRNLQIAVNDRASWHQPDTLCAIHILSMYELLGFPAASKAWEQHISGAMHLVKMRGPGNFRTNFEKSILLSLMAPFICECLRLGQPCFFEERAWKQTLLSATDPKDLFTPHSCLYVRLSLLCAAVPRLFANVARAVLQPDTFCPSDLDSLEDELLQLEKTILNWREDFMLLGCTVDQSQWSSVEHDHQAQLDGASLGMLAIICRLASAVSTDRLGAELRSLGYVNDMEGRLVAHKPTNPWAEFYLGQKVVMPHSILDSTEDWLRRPLADDRVVEDWKFKAWHAAIAKSFENNG